MINTDVDRTSFADSDQFDDDSVNSWISDSEDQINNWRGWKKTYPVLVKNGITQEVNYNQPEKLLNQAAKIVAAIQPGFDLTVHGSPFPEELIKLVASYSFPNSEEEIRLYSCLGCGNVDEFIRGENLYKTKSVRECLQIGFHLSAKVLRRPINSQPNNDGNDSAPQFDNGYTYSHPNNVTIDLNTNSRPSVSNSRQMNNAAIPGQSLYNNNICKVSVTFDRGRITSCNCSCDFLDCVDKVWCSHVVAACLYRIHDAKSIQIRAPISESLSKLSKEDLQKFAQFLISKMNLADILPAAQNILDELLASDNNPMKAVRGAPDLTAGASIEDNPMWFFDHLYIEENISKILQKFCVPKPVVYGDPRHLSNNLPMVAQEYQNILRPMRGKEPEGIWNLISIIRDMFRREDSNALCLLRILTRCLLQSKPIMMWWYCIKLNQDWCLKTNSPASNSLHSQYASAYFCDEMVQLWRIAALRYCLSSCNFVTTRRLPVHRSDQGTETIADLMAEIKNLHQTVIKTAISSLDKPPSRNVINYANNMGTNNRHPIQPGNNAASNSPVNALQPSSTSLIIEDTQRQFIGFKPAYDACRSSISIQSQSSETLLDSATVAPVQIGADSIENSSGVMDIHNPAVNNTGWNSEGYYDMDSVMNQSDNSMDTDIVVNEFDIDCDPANSFLTTTIFDNAKNFDDMDLRYAKCESLFYHGYPNESTQLAYELSEDLLNRKSEIFDKFYRLGRIALIATHQKLNEYNQLNHNSNQQASQSSQLHGRNNFTNNNKKRFRFHTSINSGLSPSISNSGKLSEDFIDADQSYEPLILMKRIQFLITCLVNDSNDQTCIPQPQRSAMPSKSRLIEIAFHLLIFGLQLPRHPAPYHHIEISMIQLEIDLISQAQQIKWRDFVPNLKHLLINIALQLKNRSLPYMTEIHVPYNLASFVFEQLNGINGVNSTESLNNSGYNNKSKQKGNIRDRTKSRTHTTENMEGVSKQDDFNGFDSVCDYGFEGALSVLGMKSKIPEKVNPLLVEGQRRLRDEFAAFLFNVYKDDVDRLTLILTELLDPTLNPHFKAAPLKFYLQNPLSKMLETIDNPEQPSSSLNGAYFASPRQTNSNSLSNKHVTDSHQHVDTSKETTPSLSNVVYPTFIPISIQNPAIISATSLPTNTEPISTNIYPPSNLSATLKSVKLHSPQSKTSKSRSEKTTHVIDTDSSALEDDNSETSIADKKVWEQKLRCFTTTKRLTNNQHSTGMAAIDSSAPETTESSDNSPTTIRKRIFRSSESNILYSIMADGVPCGGELEGNNVIEEKKTVLETKGDEIVVSNDLSAEIESTEVIDQAESSHSMSLSESSSPPLNCDLDPLSKSPKTSPLQSKESLDSISNEDLKPDINSDFIDEKFDVTECITESLAHHMFELAQTVLQRAGIPDDSSTPVFRVNNGNTSAHSSNQQSSASNHLAQRNLQLCAFQLGLYALGLYNHLNSLWQSRTYSSHVAWITTQVVDFGVSAACVLLHSWRHHLNPSEVAEIAYRVSKRRDTHMSRVGSELCLAVLAESSTLNPTQIVRGLRQCGDQSNEILERGLLSVESGANNSLSGVQPIIYFHLAQAWFQLHRNEVGPNLVATSSAVSGSQYNNPTQNNSSSSAQTMTNISSSIQPSFGAANMSSYPPPMIPAITQINNNNMHNLVISQPTQMPAVPFGSPLSLSNHAAAVNPAWIYGNIINSHGVNNQMGSYLSQFQVIRGLANSGSPYNPNLSGRQIYFYQPTSISPHQLQPPHPGSNFSHQIHMIPTCTGTNWSLNSPSNVNSGTSQISALSPTSSHSQGHFNGDNRAYDYLLRAFNSAMKAIHILFQIQTSTSVGTDSPNGNTNNTVSANSRRPIIFNSVSTIDINDYPTSTSTESQSHDTNIKWTLKLARLLGAEEVNRYSMLIFQFIHNPFLMKEIIIEVMEFYNLSQLNIPSDYASTVSSGSINLIQNPLAASHHNCNLLSGARQQGMVLPIPASYPMIRSNTNIGFPSVSGLGQYNLPNYNTHGVNPPLQNNHSHNPFNLTIPVNTTQSGVELVHKLVNRLHYLFRRLIEKRLQQTGQGPRDWDLLVELILEAYRAQRSLPASDPSLNWVEIMQKIKTNRKCTKDLWARIYAGLQTLDQI